MSMNKLAQKVVGYIDVTGKALGVALITVKQAELSKKAAAEKIRPLIDQLISVDLLKESQRKVAEQQLLNHADALDVTANIIDAMHTQLKTAQAKIAALNNGQAVEGDATSSHTKKASANEDPDAALLAIVPALSSKYSS